MSEDVYSIYKQLGYEDRYDYFTDLSTHCNVPVMKIILKAEQLGIEQDFDKLLDWLDAIRQNENKHKL